MRVVEGEYVPGERYNLRASGGPPQPSPMGDHANELQANDPVSGRTVWRVEWPTANYTIVASSRASDPAVAVEARRTPLHATGAPARRCTSLRCRRAPPEQEASEKAER